MPTPTTPPPTTKKNLSAKPTRKIFDSWNSSSTGHQRAENRLSGSTSWRESRSLKLGEQFSSGLGGGKRLADTVGAGSEDFGKDGRLKNGGWERGAKGLRKGGQVSLQEAFGVRKPGAERSGFEKVAEKEDDGRMLLDMEGEVREVEELQPEPRRPQIFRDLTVYVNGSTAPIVSDHQLKRLLVTHGARVSIALGRRTVTHVILGRPNGMLVGSGSGGGLATSKIQKEIRSKVGNTVKFVTVEWVMESIKQGRRVPEGRFEALRLAPKGTGNLVGMFAKAKG